MIIFRADGNEIIGSGHVMRCLSIADAFKMAGKECIFVLADSRAQAIIELKGYKTIVLESLYDRLDAEISSIKSVLDSIGPELVIIDSYFVTPYYLQELKYRWKIAYVDDLASFAYPVNKLINYNVYASMIDYVQIYEKGKIGLPQCFLGTNYVPLRREFRNLNKHILKMKVENVLVSTGGADSTHLALGFVRYLNEHNSVGESIRFHIILGAMNPDKQEIKGIAKKMENVVIHENVMDMKSLMMSSDIAVSAAGSTLYELCACGVPTITYVLADNQISSARAFDEMGLMQFLEDVRNNTYIEADIMDVINALSEDFEKRKRMSELMQSMVDGYGANRLVEELLKE